MSKTSPFEPLSAAWLTFMEPLALCHWVNRSAVPPAHESMRMMRRETPASEFALSDSLAGASGLDPLSMWRCLIFLLPVFVWLVPVFRVPVLRAADKIDVPAGYEVAPIAAGNVKKPEPAPAKVSPALHQGVGVVQAFSELLEKTAGDRPGEKPKEVVDPRVLALERQFRPQLQKLLKVERYRVYLVCDLSPENRRLFASQLDPLLQDVVRIYCLAENQRRRGTQQKLGLDPQQLIRDRMARLVQEEFGPDAARRYFDANRLCRDRRKRVTVVNMVSLIDRQLIFSAEQRRRLTESLTAHWQDAWGQALPLFLLGSPYLPRVPDSLILPLLDKNQKAVWRGLPKKNNRMVLGNLTFGLRFGVVEEEEGREQ